MADPANTQEPNSSSDQSASSEPIAIPDSNASNEGTGQTVMQATLSETGEEASEVRQRSGAVGVGFKIGPYLLVRKLGQGGMGAVYEAQHTKLDKTFALKVLPPGFASNAAALSRFEREMKAVGKLDHPNIIRATNADEFNGTHYLVMEYIEGCDLSRFVKDRGTLSIAEACETIRQAALGLQHAHEHGLIHRDVKPSNLFVCDTQQARRASEWPGSTNESDHSLARRAYESVAIKILDLGLARLEDDVTGGGLTSSGQVLGTPDYMAPEQWDDTRAADARADLYALGCTLFFVLTGKAPFAEEGSKPSLMRLMKAHVEGPIPDLLAVRPDVPAELNSIYRRLLAKNPDDRFQTAAAVVTVLQAVGSSSCATAVSAVPASTNNTAHRAVAHASRPVAPRQGYEDTPTTSIITPRPAPHAASTTRKRVLVAVSLIAFAVIASLVLNHRHNDGSSKLEPVTSPIEIQKSKIENPAGWHGWPADAPKPAVAPFNADEARQHQEAWAKYLNVPVEYENSLGMKFRLIPPGEFTMGSTKEEIEDVLKVSGNNSPEFVKSEAPQHRVILTQPIYLGVHEVTQAQYEQVMGKNPSHFTPIGVGKDAITEIETTTHPVEMVSWADAADFCSRLSQQEKLKPFYFRAGETVTALGGTGYRLPTEAEWELACRAGTTTTYWIGDKDSDLMQAGWFTGNSGARTHVVGELKANPFGLYDVHGNVYEWVQDWWEPTHYQRFQGKSAVDPSGDSSAGSNRSCRGASWYEEAWSCRSAFRGNLGPSNHGKNVGFRIVVSPAAQQAERKGSKVTGPALPKSVAATPSAPAGDSEKLPAKFSNRLGMEFVLVGKGTAWLGGGNGQQGEKKVEMPDDFYLGRYEVTQAEWEQVTGQNPSHFSRTGAGKDALKDISDADLKRFPVEMVSWDDAQLFLERLNKQEPSAGWAYRLPKESEWEYACRGGPLSDKLDSAFDFYFDKPTNQLLPDQANFAPEPGKGLLRTCKVGTYKPNRLGLYDMHGNVHEWCDDTEKAANGVSLGVIRGGGWIDAPELCRAWYRFALFTPSSRNDHVGFRLARIPVGPAKPKPVATTPSAPALAPIDFAAERKAAEWLARVLDTSCYIHLRKEDGSLVSLTPDQRTVPEGNFFVETVSIRDSSLGTPIDGVDDASLTHLSGCRRLMNLALAVKKLTVTGVQHIPPSSTLTRLGLDYTAVDDRLWPLLAQWPNLTFLNLSGCQAISDRGLLTLPKLLRPWGLDVSKTQITDRGLQTLADRAPHLRELSIDQDDGESFRSLIPVRNFSELERLECSASQVTADGVTNLLSLRRLERLQVNGRLHDTTFEWLLPLRGQLKHFTMYTWAASKSPPTSRAYEHLAQFSRLEELDVSGSQGAPTDKDLLRLAGLPLVKRLKVNFGESSHSPDAPNVGRQYTPAGIDAFRKARPDVELRIDGKDYPAVAASDAPIDFAAERKAAEWLARGLKATDIFVHLRLQDGSRVTLTPNQRTLPNEEFFVEAVSLSDPNLDDTGLSKLSHCRRLTRVRIGGSATTAVLSQLPALPTLVDLGLDNSAVDDELFPLLTRWPNLQNLDLFGCQKITDQGLASFPRLVGPLSVWLGGTRITDDGLRTLAERCPSISFITVDLDDGDKSRSLAPLRHFPNLTGVRCGASQVTEAGVATLVERTVVDRLDIMDRTSDATMERLIPLRKQLKHLAIEMNVLTASPLTSHGYARLETFEKLEELYLGDGEGSPNDSDLLVFAKLPKLKWLTLRFVEKAQDPVNHPNARRQYTPAGIEAFRKARPDVRLTIDGQEYPATK